MRSALLATLGGRAWAAATPSASSKAILSSNAFSFPALGRLRVPRTVTDGAPNEAGVYDRESNLVDVVQ